MNVRRLVPFFILSIFAIALIQTGCDTLVTENNTIRVYDSSIAVECFDCHNDGTNPLLRPKGQFDNSAHANFALLDTDNCLKACHTHEGFLAAIDTLAGNPATINTDLLSAITCYTCHAAHPNEPGTFGQWSMDSSSIRGRDINPVLASGLGTNMGLSNNCAHCHQAIQGHIPTVDPNFGPHFSPQTDIVSGRNGAFIGVAGNDPSDSTNVLTSAHFDNGCITCHYGDIKNDNDGQGYLFAEHTFRLKDPDTDQMYFGTCQPAGCHGGVTMDQTFIDSSTYLISIDALADTVQIFLEAFEILDPSDTTGRTINTATTRTPILDSALYNFLLYNYDNSYGIHNPIFVKALLDTTKTVLDSLPPLISFIADAPANCLNTVITFTPTVIGTFDTLMWNFGDGVIDTTIDENPVTHSYATSGSFPVSLIALSYYTQDSLNDAGDAVIYDTVLGADTLLITDFVAIEPLINPSFVIDTNGIQFTTPITICIGDTLHFVSTSIVGGTPSYTWNFGYGTDEIVSTDSISHVFDTIGTLSPMLNITTTCYDTTIMISDLVIVDGAKAIIDTSYIDTVYTFTSNSLGTLDSLRWDIDADGTYDSLNSPITVTYNLGVGPIYVYLQVFNSNCGPHLDSILVNP